MPGDANRKNSLKNTGGGKQGSGESPVKDELDQITDADSEERDADPGQRQKQNQGEQKDDDLAA